MAKNGERNVEALASKAAVRLNNVLCKQPVYIAAVIAAALVSGEAQAVVDGVCREARATYGSVVRLGGPNTPFCSGVLLSNKVVLTAAHCVVNRIQNGEIVTVMHMQRQGSRTTNCITHSNQAHNFDKCVPRRFKVALNPGYRSGDAQSDIAVLRIVNNKLRYRGNKDIPKTHFARLYKDKWNKSRHQVVAGFGPCNPSGAGWGEYHETRIRQTDFRDYHYVTKAGPNSRLCKGDSGGPAFLKDTPRTYPVVVGLAVGFTNKLGDQRHCTERGEKQRWVKVSPKTEWISRSIERLGGRACRAPYENRLGVDYRLCFD